MEMDKKMAQATHFAERLKYTLSFSQASKSALLELECTRTSDLDLEPAVDTEVYALVAAFQVENAVK